MTVKTSFRSWREFAGWEEKTERFLLGHLERRFLRSGTQPGARVLEIGAGRNPALSLETLRELEVDYTLLDGQGIKMAGESILQESLDSPRIIFDLSVVEYLSSAVLGELVALYKKIRKLDGKILLCSVKDSIEEIFRVTKMNELFEIFPAREEAHSSFAT